MSGRCTQKFFTDEVCDQKSLVITVLGSQTVVENQGNKGATHTEGLGPLLIVAV